MDWLGKHVCFLTENQARNLHVILDYSNNFCRLHSYMCMVKYTKDKGNILKIKSPFKNYLKGLEDHKLKRWLGMKSGSECTRTAISQQIYSLRGNIIYIKLKIHRPLAPQWLYGSTLIYLESAKETVYPFIYVSFYVFEFLVSH